MRKVFTDYTTNQRDTLRWLLESCSLEELKESEERIRMRFNHLSDEEWEEIYKAYVEYEESNDYMDKR